MERVFMTLAVWTTLAFADASFLLAASSEVEEIELIRASGPVAQLDFMTTGPRESTTSQGIMPHLDGCSAECQAERLGLVFDD
ncbi:MAG: hypothetical protein AAGF25_07090 [Pseudomonadota bacterium]